MSKPFIRAFSLSFFSYCEDNSQTNDKSKQIFVAGKSLLIFTKANNKQHVLVLFFLSTVHGGRIQPLQSLLVLHVYCYCDMA